MDKGEVYLNNFQQVSTFLAMVLIQVLNICVCQCQTIRDCKVPIADISQTK